MAWALGLIGALALDDPRRRFPAYAALLTISAIGWLMTPSAPSRNHAFAIVAAAVCVRLWAWSLPPAFSDDVFRYVYEGRVALLEGPAFPFRHPPSEGPTHGLPPALFDEGWRRINHAHIPTLYPPLTQLVLMLGALLGGLGALKALLIAAELAGCAALRGDGAWIRAMSCPLLVTEVAREGHADALVVLGLAVATRHAAAGFAIATWAKLIGALPLVALILGRKRPRGWWAWGLIAGLAAVPYVLASGEGLTRYAATWRSGDGAFSLVLWSVERVIGGTWAELPVLGTITRDALARAAALALLAALAWPWRRSEELGAALVLLALLLAPTFHPWYALWLLPLAVLGGPLAAPARWLIATAPLLHHPGWLALTTDAWTELWWLRALVHLPAWALLIRSCTLAACRSRPPPSSRSTEAASS